MQEASSQEGMAHSRVKASRTQGLRASVMKYSQNSSAWEREDGESKVSLGFLRPYLKRTTKFDFNQSLRPWGAHTYIHVGKHTHKINQVGPASEAGLGFQKAAPWSPGALAPAMLAA